MINIKNQLPNIYYDTSRDFQILGHLYEVVLNYVKTNADMLYLLPNSIEEDTVMYPYIHKVLDRIGKENA